MERGSGSKVPMQPRRRGEEVGDLWEMVFQVTKSGKVAVADRREV